MSRVFGERGTGGRRRWGRLFSGGERRRAIEAEAGGDYAEAARAYAAADDRTKVAEMHLLESECGPDPESKLASLREAARWTDGDEDDDTRRVRRRIATALLGWVRSRGVITEGDRGVVSEAAALFRAAGDAAGAGECHELLGAAGAAADAYQTAGEVDQLERVLDTEADRRRRAVALGEAIEEHRLRLRAGDPAGALASLAAGLEAADARERAALQRMHEELIARRLASGRLELRGASGRLLVVASPVTVGRELDSRLPLRDGGVSRHHAELVHEGTGWTLVDLGSKNGSSLGGVRVVGRLPLPPEGELSFGDRCAVSFSCAATQLELEIIRGMDRGLRVVVPAVGALTPIAARAGSTPLLTVRFVEGRARVRALGADRVLRVNGSSVAGEVEPLRADVLEVGDTRWEVGE